MKDPPRKDHDKMTEHELRTEVILLRAKINGLEAKPKVTREFIEKLVDEINKTVTPAGISFAEIIKFAYKEAGVEVEE